jgi:plasmid replication initiation protein
MAKKSKMINGIEGIQSNSSKIILSNDLSTPKFIKQFSKSDIRVVNDVCTPKLFFEIASLLKPDIVEHLNSDQYTTVRISLKEFVKAIDIGTNNYHYVLNAIFSLTQMQAHWDIPNTEKEVVVALVSKVIHDKGSGYVDLHIDGDLAKKILEVNTKGNFSFNKSILFRLQGIASIKLYPFFKSWQNYKEPLYIDLPRFKKMFGFDTRGYERFALLKLKVLDPAINEINAKTDINVSSLKPKRRSNPNSLKLQKP